MLGFAMSDGKVQVADEGPWFWMGSERKGGKTRGL